MNESTSWSSLIDNELTAAVKRQEEKCKQMDVDGATQDGFQYGLFEKACRSKRNVGPAGSRLKRPRIKDDSISPKKGRKKRRSEAEITETSLLDRLCEDEKQAGDVVVSKRAAELLAEAWGMEGHLEQPSDETIERLEDESEGQLDRRCVVGFWEKQRKREKIKSGGKVDKGKERSKLLKVKVMRTDVVTRKYMKALAKESSPIVRRKALLSIFNDPSEDEKPEVLKNFVNRKGIELLGEWLSNLVSDRKPNVPLAEACLGLLDELDITEGTLRNTGIGRVVTAVVKRFAGVSEGVVTGGRELLVKWKDMVTRSRRPSAAAAAEERTDGEGDDSKSEEKSRKDGAGLEGVLEEDEMKVPTGEEVDLDSLMDLMGEVDEVKEDAQIGRNLNDPLDPLRLMALPGSEDFDDEEQPSTGVVIPPVTEYCPRIRWKEDSELVSMVLFQKNEPLWDTVAAISNARGKHVKYVEHGHTSKFVEQRRKEAAMGRGIGKFDEFAMMMPSRWHGGSGLGQRHGETPRENSKSEARDSVTPSVIFDPDAVPYICVPPDCAVDDKTLSSRSYERQDLADLHGIRPEELYDKTRIPNSPAEPDAHSGVLGLVKHDSTIHMPLRNRQRDRSPPSKPEDHKAGKLEGLRSFGFCYW
ncbi:hypothetical protein FOL47_004494 [Perkinsus chesapeaki]|uniref:TFIIS N-terminal domain-containing protein n=1 Tax=Perkinsus chesapeaki TaxID=330153 RepID=A0A7J6M394_PERCH|nr:hypothetical protein FOL47_004494 [Perkinsus chesapeaki]